MPESQDITLRPATVADVPQIHHLINDAAEFALMLPRPMASLYENVREFQVATPVPGSIPDKIIGVCGLSIVWANLAEVCSLVVSPDYRGQGIGQRLVQACLDEARQLAIRRVMTLTYEQAFFEKLGFSIVDRQQLPLKVWSECIRCPKNQACDEIAMIRVFDDIPESIGPPPATPSPEKYIVPTIARHTR